LLVITELLMSMVKMIGRLHIDHDHDLYIPPLPTGITIKKLKKIT
jgi:hypothetical protein